MKLQDMEVRGTIENIWQQARLQKVIISACQPYEVNLLDVCADAQSTDQEILHRINGSSGKRL